MKRLLIILLFIGCYYTLQAQVVTTNRNVVGMEHNILFNANDRYTVTQTGSATLILDYLFDGKLKPSYTSTEPSFENPTVITIEGLPEAHIQVQAVIGWTTRWCPPTRFKIEGYETYYNNDEWVTLADYSEQDYSGYSFYLNLYSGHLGRYPKIRFTFYQVSETDNTLGISELFFMHPEATSPYEGLLVSQEDTWQKTGDDLYYDEGNIGIGVPSPANKLEVDGTIRATEVIVETGWADYVFSDNYNLSSLEKLSEYINENKHLPGVPESEDIVSSGLSLGEISKIQMEKIEELTLYLIEQDKRLKTLERQNKELINMLNSLMNNSNQ